MKSVHKFLGLFIVIIFQSGFSQDYPDEIIFYSNGSTFSPLIYVEGNATIQWTFNDSTTSSLARPIKNYGTEQLRINRLKVTPWSAVVGINIGYDGSDGGSLSIPFVPNQKVSKVENLDLVASNLELWCSSYNILDSLNFDNFTNLKTVECFRSQTVQKVSLKNTPNLVRLCLEDNNLKELDISECTNLEDLRAALNDYKDINFPDSTTRLWHICIRDNPQLTNTSLFSNMEKFPYLSELLIWNSNQSGNFVLHQTITDSIEIEANQNNYTSFDFSGALQNENGWASILLASNKINSVNLAGCDQIKHIELYSNELPADSVDKVLQQLDDFGTSNGVVYLRENAIPTSVGFSIIKNLEARGWIVHTDNYSDIRVFGNNNEILNRVYITPSKSNLTDFDSVDVESGSIIHNFVIKSVGTTDLRLLGTDYLGTPPYIWISGTNASDFNVTKEPSTLIPAGDSTTFQITFNPTNVGLRTAVVSFTNNDWEQNSFDFSIQGTGTTITSIDEIPSLIPDKFGLSQNYPNPFNPSTVIRYQLPVTGLVILKVYDLLGNEVATLVNEQRTAGSYEIRFEAGDLPSGLYLYKIQAGSFVQTKKMILLK